MVTPAPEPDTGQPEVNSDPYIDGQVPDDLSLFPGLGSKTNREIMAQINPDLETPDDVKHVLEENSLGRTRVYTCKLKRFPEGGESLQNAASAQFVQAWRCGFPSEKYVMQEYGPGRYLLIFSWNVNERLAGGDKKYQTKVVEIPLEIGEACRDDYEEYQDQKRIRRAERQARDLQRYREKQALNTMASGASPILDKNQAGKEYLREFGETARMLGMSTPIAPAAPQGSLLKDLVPGIVAAIPAVLSYLSNSAEKQNARMDNLLQMLVTTMQANTANMIAAMKGANGPTTGTEILKEITGMVMGAVNLKETLEGNKETVVDKIFRMIEGVAPQIVQLAQLSKQQRMMDPRYMMGKTMMNADPNLSQLKKDPEILEMSVRKWDEQLGWEQTDAILTIGEMRRPDTCPRVESQRYPLGDARNVQVQSREQGQNQEEEEEENVTGTGEDSDPAGNVAQAQQ